jgi:hypothetical protein
MARDFGKIFPPARGKIISSNYHYNHDIISKFKINYQNFVLDGVELDEFHKLRLLFTNTMSAKNSQ